MIDHRSDIWSLGVIIRELGTKYRHISQRCVRRDRTKRYASCAEVKKAILQEGYRKLLIWISVIGVSALLAIAGVLYTASRPEPSVPTVDEDTTVPMDTLDSEETSVPSATKGVAEEIDKPESSEDLDATSLEDLFNEAAQQIL